MLVSGLHFISSPSTQLEVWFEEGAVFLAIWAWNFFWTWKPASLVWLMAGQAGLSLGCHRRQVSPPALWHVAGEERQCQRMGCCCASWMRLRGAPSGKQCLQSTMLFMEIPLGVSELPKGSAGPSSHRWWILQHSDHQIRAQCHKPPLFCSSYSTRMARDWDMPLR